ncbi:MAG: D-alanine--D-alanine ligase family protein [Desulfobacterales bacterium]
MRVAVVHHEVAPDAPADELDVLDQVQVVVDALNALGHDARVLACSLNLAAVKTEMERLAPDVVFNLVESLDGQGRLIHLFPALLDGMGVAYTGAPAEAIFLTSNKVLAKERLAGSGLPTPAWLSGQERGTIFRTGAESRDTPIASRSWLVKSLWEHASIGIEAESIVTEASRMGLRRILEGKAGGLGDACFAEEYIDGREFNLSLLGGPAGPQVLTPAEIRFEGFGEDRPRIVGYRAKWQADSYEFHHTPRCFSFEPRDHGLLDRLRSLAGDCWHLFGLKGYARVDFRVDHQGQPWILEINTNPCLSPDAGFAAAVLESGLSVVEAVDRILSDAIRGNRPGSPDREESARSRVVHEEAPVPGAANS